MNWFLYNIFKIVKLEKYALVQHEHTLLFEAAARQ